MIRDVDILDISDGRSYRSDDLVRVGSSDCAGCSRCCHDMGNIIVLDPYDVFRLEQGLACSFDQLLEDRLQLSVIDALILPSLAMTETDEDGMKGKGPCVFLNREGRCSIHAFRPGLCRLFPLGRYYEGNDFCYILQVNECDRAKTKIRIRKWLQEPELEKYEQFVRDWHALTRALMHLVENSGEDLHRTVCVRLLQVFYRREWDLAGPFFPQFDAILPEARHMFGLS